MGVIMRIIAPYELHQYTEMLHRPLKVNKKKIKRLWEDGGMVQGVYWNDVLSKP